MKIYISGKISGQEKRAARQFSKAEKEILKTGHQPINPMKLNQNHDGSWESYMKECIKALCDADILVFLSGWERSKGAQLELRIATELGIETTFYKSFIQKQHENETGKTENGTEPAKRLPSSTNLFNCLLEFCNLSNLQMTWKQKKRKSKRAKETK